MKQVHRIIVITIALCVALVNTGALYAVHLHQCHVNCDTSGTTHRDEKHQSGSGHDPDKCPFCIQFASIKAISFDFTEHISFTTGGTEECFSFRAVCLPSVSLSSESPRAPPFVC